MSTVSRVGPAPEIAIESAGAGEVVLFMHGIGGNRTNWHGQLEAFSPHYHGVAWDARGYGDSSDYPGPLDFADFASDLLRVLDHLGASRAHLCGLSMGGRIATDFYEKHPERVASLILCDTFPGFSNLAPDQREAFVRSRKEPLVNGQEPRDIAPAVAKTLVSETAEPAVVRQLEASMCALHKESYIKAIEAMVFYPKSAALETIEVPTLFVVGEHDRLTPPELSKDMAARVTGAELCVIERAGHLTNLERPEAFNRAVLDFLGRVTQP